MKFVLCTIIVLFSGIAGLIIKNQIDKKICYFEEINMFLQFLSVKIAFFQNYYADCIRDFIAQHKLKNQQFFENIEALISSSNFNFQAVEKLTPQLQPSEQEFVFKIFSSIGFSDIISQQKIIDGLTKQNDLLLAQLKTQKEIKGDPAVKLSLCAGLVIAILIY